MIGFLIRLAVSAVALLVIAGASNGQIVVTSASAALIAALVLGVVNALVKPVLEFVLKALTFPLSCLTLGLWSLVLSALLNGGLFLAVAKALDGFDVKSFGVAVIGGLVLAGVNAVASGLTQSDRRAQARRR